MKTVTRLLSLLLCLEFILAPMPGSMIMSEAFAEDCSAGMFYDSSLNRCLTKPEVAKVQKAVADCGGDKECYKQNAQNALSDSGVDQGNAGMFKDDGKQRGGAKAMNAVTLAIPLVVVTGVLLEAKGNKSFKCSPPSLLLMYAAAAALGVGEIYGSIVHASKLKKIKEKWDETVVPKEADGLTADSKKAQATEAQSQAFEFLAQNEDQVAKTTKTKKGFYLAATGLFAAGAVAAGFEQFQLASAKVKLNTAMAASPPDAAGILAARQTIAKMTCFTDSSLNNKTKGEQEQIDRDQLKADQQENLEKGLKEREDFDLANPPPDPKPISVPKPKEFIGPQDDPNKLPCSVAANGVPCKSGIDSKEQEKLKRVAAYNVSTAKDAEQLLQLMNEYDSIEFDNYSKASYLGTEHKDLSKIEISPSIASVIASSLIPKAQAGEGGGMIMSVASMAIPFFLSGGVDKILGKVKMSGGKPITAETLKEVKAGSQNMIVKAIGQPYTRLAINGVLGTWMGIMEQQMNKQQHLSEDRAKKLRQMKEGFVSNSGITACTDEDRKDSSKPSCYCYTSDNKVNPNRSSSEVCSNALVTLANDTGNEGPSEKVCVTQDLKMDAACTCKANKSCLKVNSGFTSASFNPSTFKMIGAVSAPAQDVFNGNIGAGDIAGSAGINAARVAKAAKDFLKKVDPGAAKASDKLETGLSNGLLSTGNGLSMSGLGSSSALPSSPAAAAAALDKELKKATEDIEVTNSGATKSNGGGFDADEPAPEFGLNAQDSATQEIEIAEVMGKQVNFGNNDITKGSDTDIFKVLSNRYQRSGMKRLFEDGKPTLDAPAKSDVNK